MGDVAASALFKFIDRFQRLRASGQRQRGGFAGRQRCRQPPALPSHRLPARSNRRAGIRWGSLRGKEDGASVSAASPRFGKAPFFSR